MPTGTFDLPPVAAGLATVAMKVTVYRYDTTNDEHPFTWLPNVVCEQIEEKWGATPAVARFRYLLDDPYAQSNGWPSRFEQVFPIDAMGPYVVQMDDRLVVMFTPPGADPFVVFDGYAQIPQVDLDAAAQRVTFVAISVAIRLWDEPILSRVQRDGASDTVADGSADYDVELKCRFNPADQTVSAQAGYLGNCVAKPTQNDDVGSYPVFLDELLKLRGAGKTKYWYISSAVCYLIAYMITRREWNKFVMFPTLSTLQVIMSAQLPQGDTGFLNPDSAVTKDIVIRDYDATNKAFPEVIEQLLGYGGFVMAFKIGNSLYSGKPQTKLVISRRDALAIAVPKPVYLQAAGGNGLDSNANNVRGLSLVRDCNQIANDWYVETALEQIEVTVLLVPLYKPVAGDEKNPKSFDSSALTNASADQRHKYRWYGVDECGDGFWSMKQQKWITGEGFDFSPIFQTEEGEPNYVERYRPGQRTLAAKDVSGEPLLATLEVFFGKKSDVPAFVPFDGEDNLTGWQTITRGWHLLDDRLGIEVSIEHPEEWHTGNANVGHAGQIMGISWISNPPSDGGDAPGAFADPPAPTPANNNFQLRLTTVIESDARTDIHAAKRMASPSKFTRTRSADAGDHFQFCAICPGSLNYYAQGGDGEDFVVMRDDTTAALTMAKQLRGAHEFPTMAGAMVIPFLTTYYELGDRINAIKGRNMSLQTNVGVSQGETPAYGWIVGRTLQCDPRQQTTLQLSDLRAEGANV